MSLVARAVNAEPLSVPSVNPWEDALLGHGLLDHRDRLLGSAAQGQIPADDLASAVVDDGVQIDPAVLSDQHARHVQVPQLAGTLDFEEPRTPPVRLVGAPLDRLALAPSRAAPAFG